MKRYPICFFIVIMLVGALNASAQKTRPTSARHTSSATQADTHSLKIFKSMLPATAKVMFIDSVVVSKAAFLSKIPLNKDIGQITVKQDGNAKQAFVLDKILRTLLHGDTAQKCHHLLLVIVV